MPVVASVANVPLIVPLWGAKVVAIARNQERLDETLSMLHGDGHRCYSYDFSKIEGIADLVTTIVSDCGRIGGMVYAAGIEKTLPFKLLKPEDYSSIFSVNTLGAIEMARQVSSIKNFSNQMGGIHSLHNGYNSKNWHGCL